MKEEQDLVALAGKPESLHLSGGKVGQKGESSVQPTLTLLTSGRIHVGHPVLSCPPPRPLLSPTPASVPGPDLQICHVAKNAFILLTDHGSHLRVVHKLL